jgi:hypothetical protein
MLQHRASYIYVTIFMLFFLIGLKPDPSLLGNRTHCIRVVENKTLCTMLGLQTVSDYKSIKIRQQKTSVTEPLI